MHVNLLHLHWVMFYKKGKIILRLYLVLTLAKYLEMFMSVMRKLNDHCWMKMLCLECVSVVYVAFLLIYHCCFVFSHELEWPFWNILVLVLTSDFSFFFLSFFFSSSEHTEMTWKTSTLSCSWAPSTPWLVPHCQWLEVISWSSFSPVSCTPSPTCSLSGHHRDHCPTSLLSCLVSLWRFRLSLPWLHTLDIFILCGWIPLSLYWCREDDLFRGVLLDYLPYGRTLHHTSKQQILLPLTD